MQQMIFFFVLLLSHSAYSHAIEQEVETGLQQITPLVTTGEHPFYVKGKGWVAARDLKKGDLVQTKDYSFSAISIIKQKSTKTDIVYNMTVDENHTYYASNSEIWILTHNNDGNCGPTSIVGEKIALLENDSFFSVGNFIKSGFQSAVYDLLENGKNGEFIIKIPKYYLDHPDGEKIDGLIRSYESMAKKLRIIDAARGDMRGSPPLHIGTGIMKGRIPYLIERKIKGVEFGAVKEIFDEEDIVNAVSFNMEPVWKAGFLHNDLHKENLLIDMDAIEKGIPLRNALTIIDYGGAREIDKLLRNHPTKSLNDLIEMDLDTVRDIFFELQ